MVNKSLKKGKICKKLNPAHFYFQPEYSKIIIFFNMLKNSWPAIEKFSPVKKIIFLRTALIFGRSHGALQGQDLKIASTPARCASFRSISARTRSISSCISAIYSCSSSIEIGYRSRLGFGMFFGRSSFSSTCNSPFTGLASVPPRR